MVKSKACARSLMSGFHFKILYVRHFAFTKPIDYRNFAASGNESITEASTGGTAPKGDGNMFAFGYDGDGRM